jgi:hypothetical protein
MGSLKVLWHSRSAVKELSAVPVVMCGGIKHNGVLCKAHVPGKRPPFGFA